MTSLVKHSILNTLFSVLIKLFSFVLMIVIARGLTVEEYAEFGQFYSVQQAMIGLVGAGCAEAVVYLTHNSQLNKMQIYKNTLFASVPITLFFLLVGIGGLAFISFRGIINEAIYGYSFALAGGCIGGYLFLFSKLNRLAENHTYALYLLYVPILVMFLTGLGFMVLLGQVNMFFLGALVGFILVAFLLRATYLPFIQNTSLQNRSITAQINRRAKPYISVAFLGWLSGYGNVFLIAFFLPDLSIAKYTFLYTLGGVMLMVASSLNQVWSPYFYRISKHDTHLNVENVSYSYYSLLSALLALSASFVVIFYQPVLDFLGGNLLNYRNSVLELSLILASFVIYTPVWHCRNHLYLKAEGLIMLKISIFSSLIGYLLMIVSIWAIGDVGVYIGVLGLSVTQVFCFGWYSYRKWAPSFAFGAIFIGLLIVFGSYVLALTQQNLLIVTLLIIFLILLCGYFFRQKIIDLIRPLSGL